MNYITECLEHLQLNRIACMAAGMTTDAMVTGHLINDLAAAKKFLLPPPHLLDIKVTTPAMKFLKLPAPVCAFEYDCPNARNEGLQGVALSTTKSTKRIALAYDTNFNIGPVSILTDTGWLREDADGILIISIYYVDEQKMWTPSMGIGYIDDQMCRESDTPTLFDNVNMRSTMEAYPLLPEAVARFLGHLPVAARQQTLINDIADEVGMAVRAALLLSAKNLKIFKVIDAPEKLNKKRLQRHKAPFFDYYSVDVFFGEGITGQQRRKVDYSKLRHILTHRPSYLVTDIRPVTGHFKTRATGVFYWSRYERPFKVKPKDEK